MKKISKQIALLFLLIFGFTAISCEDSEPTADFKTIITTGKWIITQNVISPGVRFGNTVSSPIITDVRAAITCKDSKYPGAYFYFEGSGQLDIEITCSNSVDKGKKILGVEKWELSSDQKILNITEKGSNVFYEVVSFDSNSFKIKGKVNYYDSFTLRNVLQDVSITFTKF